MGNVRLKVTCAGFREATIQNERAGKRMSACPDVDSTRVICRKGESLLIQGLQKYFLFFNPPCDLLATGLKFL